MRRLPSLSAQIAACGLLAALFASPAAAQRTYMPSGPSDGYGGSSTGRVPDRTPERYPEPRRPRPQGYPGGGFPGPGIGIIVAPPIYDAPPLRVIYEDAEPAPSRPARKPDKQKQKQKPAVAKKPPPASPPPAKPATTARPAAPPPPVRAVAAPDYVPDEVVFELKPDISEAEIAGVLRRFALTPLARYDLALLGTSIQHARIPRGSAVPTVVRQLAADPRVASAQPNLVFDGQADEAVAPVAGRPELAGAQYAPDRMKIPEAHRLAEGRDVLVAVIDSAVDPAHPELADALIDPDAKVKPHTHGTGMAGAIAAHVKLVGIAPEARLLALDALRYDTTGAAKGTSIDIITALDMAGKRGARVVNLSFAGPRDELMARALRALRLRGAVLVAAAGNEGPKAKPLFPAAHPDVIAVTATGPDDALYAQANIGAQIAIAAPGVEVMVPAPGGAYQVLSGTSLASAHVSGVAALMLQGHPELTPAQVREALVRTARDLGKPGRDDLYGAGLIDAAAAVAAASEAAATTPAAASPEAAAIR
ncbi:S8 family serine peptidase [Starkeya sp. ORNL1]|uniref:S8 family peptidase n=1 Tax=Starkeya sp. ORNL1 TaxID=2709380 RepID=UPI00146389CF|nr:S8 family serine peptidase [Starkeya sp. ORNL1]QJP15370.1 S8 family serine peptidase [Starkeya sp. ORNL1]